MITEEAAKGLGGDRGPEGAIARYRPTRRLTASITPWARSSQVLDPR